MPNQSSMSLFMQKRIIERDKEYLSPRERADLINTFLFEALGLDSPKDVIRHPLYWDLTCFCTEFLNLFALQSEDQRLLKSTISTNNWIYSFHYSVDESAALGPGKEEHEKIWHDRINSLVEEGKEDDDKERDV